jgi:hypothetical protein
MDDLVEQIAAVTGLDRATARTGLGILVGFVAREAPAEKVAAVIGKLPGARALADEYNAGSSGLLGVFNDLTGAGLGLTEIQAVATGFAAYARQEAGDADVDAIIGAIPGLNQFI